MTTLKLLSHLRSLDVKICLEKGRLQCDAPKGVLTQHLKAELSNRKEEILFFLQEANSSAFSSKSVISPVSREGTLPLSFSQQRLWFLDQLEPGSTTYLISRALRLRGPLNHSALEQSLNTLVNRHESLRTTFVVREGSPVQVIAPSLTLALPVVDLQALCPKEQERAIQEHVKEDTRTPFDLTVGPLIRATVLRLGPEDHAFLLTLHHIITDGWSMGILFRELATVYRAICAGHVATHVPDTEPE